MNISTILGGVIVEVTVCVGSSCHLKGAAGVVTKFQEMVEQYPIYNINLGGSFCQDRCREGVIVAIDGIIHTRVKPENVRELLEKHMKGEYLSD